MEIKQNYVRLNLNFAWNKPTYPNRTHTHTHIDTYHTFAEPARRLNHNVPLHAIILTDREVCVSVVFLLLLLSLLCLQVIYCIHCVRVSVSFTSTVNYVGIHIAQHNKITTDTYSTHFKEEIRFFLTWPKAVKRRTKLHSFHTTPTASQPSVI